MINIIGGQFKRKKIEVPIKNVRPTSSIKREAIFSILESYALQNSFNLYKKKCFIDLFAGSGALGLEAVSRGAEFVYFYENDVEVYKILSSNCKKICKNNQYIAYNEDSSIFNASHINQLVSVIFIDPPYNLKILDIILIRVIELNILDKDSIIVIETKKENLVKFYNEFIVIKEKIYGKTKILFLRKN